MDIHLCASTTLWAEEAIAQERRLAEEGGEWLKVQMVFQSILGPRFRWFSKPLWAQGSEDFSIHSGTKVQRIFQSFLGPRFRKLSNTFWRFGHGQGRTLEVIWVGVRSATDLAVCIGPSESSSTGVRL